MTIILVSMMLMKIVSTTPLPQL